MRKLDYLLDRLLRLLVGGRLTQRFLKSLVLSHYVSRALLRSYNFYIRAKLEREYDAVKKDYQLRPRVETAKDHVINMDVANRNLVDINRILDEQGIKHWLVFGTFLGVYRNGSLIPYDNDMDIAIYAEDLSALIDCEDIFARAGFFLGVEPGVATLHRDGENTDFYPFQLEGNERVWVSVRYDTSAFEEYNEIDFLGQKFRIFNEPERWLRYTYGDDWRTPIKGKSLSEGNPYGIRSE